MNSTVEGTIATVLDAHGTIISMTPRFLVDRRLSGNRLVAVAGFVAIRKAE